jgi:F-type H+-transporting ATPase subunit delta
MSVTKIVSRYAKSLFDLSKADNTLDKVHEDVMYAWEVAKTEDFRDFLKSPLIPVEKKENVFKAIFGDRVEASVLRTFDAMVEHKRESYLVDFCRAFHLMYNESQHISSVRLVSAVELSEGVVEDLLAVFKSKGLVQQQVELVKAVDPAIIGGFILEFDDQVYNASVAYKLESLKKKFSENLYTKNI